jgi:hypothetical protein
MIVWCQVKSEWPVILITKPSRKRLFCLLRLCSG